MKRALIGVAIMIAALALVLGCSRDEKGMGSDVTAFNGYTAPQSPAYANCSGEGFQLLSYELFEFNGSEDPRFTQALSHSEVQGTFAIFEERGYAFDPANSFLMEGEGIAEGSSDTIDVLVVSLIMRNVADSMRDFIQVAYLASPDHPDIQPVVRAAVFSLVWPASDFASYEQFLVGYDDWGNEVYIWAKDWMSVFADGDDSAVLAKPAWCWRCWARCTLSGFIGGCAGGALRCLLTGPGAAQCAAISCGAAAVGSALGCAAGQLL